jgi:hypothetical protein
MPRMKSGVRTLQHDRAQRTTDDDQHCRRLRQRSEMSALQNLAADDRQEADQQTDDADPIHDVRLSRCFLAVAEQAARKRITAWLCN